MCPEEIGFDLCGACQSHPGQHKGRFNQQHTVDHVMEERPQEHTWLHHQQATNPQMSVNEIIRLAELESDS